MSFYKKELTRQSLTSDEFLNLLGISIWVFNSNISFLIEMLDKEHHNTTEFLRRDLLKLTAGQLAGLSKKTEKYGIKLREILGEEIATLFVEIIDKRNAIIHSTPTGNDNLGYVVPVYYGKDTIYITKKYLIEFIRLNDKLSLLIYNKRNDLKK